MVALAAAILDSSTYFKHIVYVVLSSFDFWNEVSHKRGTFMVLDFPQQPLSWVSGGGGETPNYVKTYFRLLQHVPKGW